MDVCVCFNKEFDALSALPQPSPHRENQAAKVKQTGENNVRELCHNFLTSFSGLIFCDNWQHQLQDSQVLLGHNLIIIKIPLSGQFSAIFK